MQSLDEYLREQERKLAEQVVPVVVGAPYQVSAYARPVLNAKAVAQCKPVREGSDMHKQIPSRYGSVLRLPADRG